ncbi:hypothetical protein GCM10025867_17030 [Frondihabitans sucicola]|uniref:Transposase n=1 Tax=Frondihabitans sucicola TaxID=1268041 RepID=A0ABM8GM16_9MICO|nr:hypothetical protein [Frondihabitans sucicola]BDZ49462.1 hypothetical protein GCM10025867_17030 [Frondihabitans sucicola]
MPFEQKYTSETRDASLARVLERRSAEPGNRSIIRETADEFEVGEQSLRGWIRAWEKANAPADEPVAAAAPASVATSAAPSPTPPEAPARRSPRARPAPTLVSPSWRPRSPSFAATARL